MLYVGILEFSSDGKEYVVRHCCGKIVNKESLTTS